MLKGQLSPAQLAALQGASQGLLNLGSDSSFSWHQHCRHARETCTCGRMAHLRLWSLDDITHLAGITGTGQPYSVASATLACDTSSDMFWQQKAYGGKILVYAGRSVTLRTHTRKARHPLSDTLPTV